MAKVDQPNVAHRPKRWDKPFGEISDANIDEILTRPDFKNIDQKRFPSDISLRDIIKNDCRLRQYKPGDLIIRAGDYGGSAFYNVSGKLQIVLRPSLPEKMLGRKTGKKRGVLSALLGMFSNKIPEYRNFGKAKPLYSGNEIETVNLFDSPLAKQVFNGPINPDSNKNALSDDYETISLNQDTLIGEIAALGRSQRTATVFAETECDVLEMRWQGLREIRLFDKEWRTRIDESYRKHMLEQIIANSPYFDGLDETSFKEVSNNTIFETHGNYEWSESFKSSKDRSVGSISEPIIAHEGDYADFVFVIAAGFARVSKTLGSSYRTLNYLKKGDVFGYEDFYDAHVNSDWKSSDDQPKIKFSLSALGYVHILKIPVSVLKEHVFPIKKQRPGKKPLAKMAETSIAINPLLDWVVEERFINGTQVMLIDQDKCVRCDDCVTACATGHENNPRFIRQGKTFENWLITNSCMHCTDPVCMIGCPTGAIHRLADGTIVINDVTCTGCTTCANSCPYQNIQMVEVRDGKGNLIVDEATSKPIIKATKCDLCASQPGGPSCVRACPHDALKRVDFQTELPALIGVNES
jgi:Fe-S-cluster-containing dehydrogenase component/CRP-like cAMP-binding protein